MDRYSRPLFAVGLGLILAASGCRSTQPEVPPGRSLTKDGQPRQAIQFSSDGHAPNAQASAPVMPSNLGGSNLAAGISTPGGRPSGEAYGGPPGAYGPIGTSGTNNPAANLNDPSTVRVSAEPNSIPLTGTAPPGLPDLNVTPSRESLPAQNPVVPGPLETPGAMSAPSPMPSPN